MTIHSARWPDDADQGAGERLLERFAAVGPEAAGLAASAGGAAMLRAVGGGSPFLSDLVVREAGTVLAFAAEGAEGPVRRAMAALAAVEPGAARPAVLRAMRVAKRRVGLLCALADIGGAWGLQRVTATLSDLAEDTLGLAVSHLLLAAHRAGSLVLPDPARPAEGCGLLVLGMGKLGARELNYSSDIDLVLLFDPEAHPDPELLGGTFTRIARALVTSMEARDADGYVFRTDLRLRPDPAATPPAVSLPAAIAYYESLGQNWERAAMTKARPVAGDLARGHAFLQAIRPFVWRRRLDFAAVADLHAMKRRIDEHRGFSPGGVEDGVPEGLAGYNLKLGPGGIREIEFSAQTLQLVWGGQDPALRDPTTLGALRRLVRAGHLTRRAAAELVVAYHVLRRLEHRLQMVADRQTHTLPEKPEELERFAVFAGCDGVAGLGRLLALHTGRVRARYAEVFNVVPDAAEGPAPLNLAGRDAPEETLERLRGMGFVNGAGMVATLRGWQAGRLRALRSARSRELMDRVLPDLLAALGRQPDPDGAFARFDAMLAQQPAGVQLLSMFQRFPALLDRVASVLGAAPSLAEHLAAVPSAVEGLLEPSFAPGPPPGVALARRLTETTALEDVVSVTSSLVRAEEFRLCCAQMDGAIGADEAGWERTALADAALAALLPAVLAEQERRFGRVRGGDVAVVALGKAGSREMMAGSDLDLMLLYTHPAGVTESDGRRPLPASQWFIRAAHAFVAALTAPGREGPLYAVDMRLRPSGNKGPVAVPLSGFARYHADDAWTWERMTLTRARVVAGRPAIRARAEAAIRAALRTPVAPGRILADAVAMRERLLRDLPAAGAWDVKLRPGGGMEVEFVAQALLLAHGLAGREPDGWQNTGAALRLLAGAGALTEEEAGVLVRADLLWRTVQSMRRIMVGRGDGMPAASVPPLLRAVEGVLGRALDLPALPGTLDGVAAQVRAVFNRRIGVVAG